jgi:hypothetical protein
VVHDDDPVEEDAMNKSTIALSANGQKPAAQAHVTDMLTWVNARTAARRGLTELGQKITDLYQLRGLLREGEKVEKALTREVLDGLAAVGLDQLQGGEVAAVVDRRTTFVADPELFYQAAGARAWTAMSVSTTAARRILAQETLEAISEPSTTVVLRITTIQPAPAAA